MASKIRVMLIPLTLLVVLVSPTTTLAQIWGLGQGQQLQQSFGQSAQPRRLQRGQQVLNDCQIDRLTANEPTNRIEAEGGVIEIWEPNQQPELRCAGVTVVRQEIERRGLALPNYVNAPHITYVVRGRGVLGVQIPGCPETYESGSSQQRFRDEGREFERGRDQHQKVRRFRQGDILALPAGVSRWVYNDGEDRIQLISLYDTDNVQNQLDENLRPFFLAGNPQGRGGERSRHRETRRHSREGRQTRESRGEQAFGQNIFNGFDQQLLAEAFNVDEEIINKLQGQDDNRGPIILVEQDLEFLRAEWDREEQRREREEPRREREESSRERQHRGGREQGGRRGREEGGRGGREQEGRGGRGGRWSDVNGVEETLCSLRLKENIDNPERADVFNPHGGRLTSLNSQKLPILNFLQLSAEKVNLYQNAILAPHWRINAHSIVYFTRGTGRVQVVDHQGNSVFDDTVNEGQLLVVPQNFAVVKRAGREGLEWVNFLTNDNAMINPLAGRISAIRGLPIEVVMNSYGISREEARQLKYNRQELSVFSPSSQSEKRGEQFAIV